MKSGGAANLFGLYANWMPLEASAFTPTENIWFDMIHYASQYAALPRA
jgi:hypothetical protein